ncbi:hypothetical protein [Sharpea azabuensis]|uniref:hypothetical protein n=1 Tax=Sharpea azabuensis TaxID=322505 RepID=UPI0023EF5853|nr:hypothetical protein [Sharpea azabuensis]
MFFCALLAIVSLFYQNYLGILVTVGILMLGSFAVYYRQHISAESFEFFMDTTLILSLVADGYNAHSFACSRTCCHHSVLYYSSSI